jgi:hypothetical protein
VAPDNSTPQRVTGIALNGEMATLKLADGSSIELPAAIIHLRDQRDVAEDKSVTGSGGKRNRGVSLQQLAAKSEGDLAAIVRVRYDKNGSARRARLQLFSNHSEASAFMEHVAKRRAEVKAAAKPNH